MPGRAEADVVLLGVLALEAQAGRRRRARAACARAALRAGGSARFAPAALEQLDAAARGRGCPPRRRRCCPATYIARW